MKQNFYQEGILYAINEIKKTASVIECSQDIKDLIIPRSINHESKEYIVISISEGAFRYSHNIISVQFSPDSAVRTIEKFAFVHSNVNSISFPASLVELEDGWCCSTTNLVKIKVDPRNPRYSCLDEKYIIGKSSITNENYDILVFAVRDIKEARIPSFIKIIAPYAFNFCLYLPQIDIPANSELRTFGEHSFSLSSIQNILIPSKLVELKEAWCEGLMELTKIEVDSRNTRYLCLSDKYLIGKSDETKDNYDVLVLVVRNIEEAKIPSFIKVISSYAFEFCFNCRKIEFPPELTTICHNAFAFSSITNISIPSSLVELENGWCKLTKKLTNIDVDQRNKRYSCIDGKMIIGKSNILNENYDVLVFASRDIEEARIPSFIKVIAPYAFEKCYKIKNVEIQPDSELQKFCEYSFARSSIQSIFIPANLIELENGCYFDTRNLTRIEVDPRNKIYSCLNEKILIGKSNESNENYDVLILSARDIINVKIPSSIKIISPHAFEYCYIQQIEIPSNSKLQTIDEFAFYESSIMSFTIPPHLTDIKKNVFGQCYQIKIVEIDEKSEMQLFNKFLFDDCYNTIIMIPTQKIGII